MDSWPVVALLEMLAEKGRWGSQVVERPMWETQEWRSTLLQLTMERLLLLLETSYSSWDPGLEIRYGCGYNFVDNSGLGGVVSLRPGKREVEISIRLCLAVDQGSRPRSAWK
jgi:hypothetical protein